ncbi:MAG: S8 family peptidase [Fusobacterium sp.]|nr:S8 family peptidase [Fusobacterium sp.]
MKITIAKEDKTMNYIVKLKDIFMENEFKKILKNYDISYKKTEYFKNFFSYKLLNINSKIITLLQTKASHYIEYIRPISFYSLPIRIDKENGYIEPIYPEKNKNYVTLGVLDNGISQIKQLKPWIRKVHTRFLKENTSCTHGTFVSGIALYGDNLENREIVINEGFNLLDSTVLPNGKIEEDDLIKNIALAIEENYKKVKIWNLSLSVKLEIDDEKMSDFGVVLDYLQKKYGVLICKSGGNGGSFMKDLPKKKLYHGSDSLMALVVSSINNQNVSSNFSRLGLGVRNTIKPDITNYGGELFKEAESIMGMNGVKSFSVDGNVCSSAGTSFATARMSGLATIIYQNICKDFKNFSDFNPTLIKSLIIHSAKNINKDLTVEEIGFGLPSTSKEILSYLSNENIKIISGEMKENFIVDLDGSFFDYKKNIKIKCSLVYETDFDYFQKGKYILSDIKIKDFSEDGENLVRKFVGNLDRRKNIELYSNNDINKKFTLIIEKK